MIGFSIPEIIGGEPVNLDDTQTSGPVYHVHLEGQPQKVLEKVIADDRNAALEKARDLVGEVGNIFVSGPHEHIAPKTVETKDDEPGDFAKKVAEGGKGVDKK